MTFEALGLNPSIIKALTEAGYTSPTPVQEKAIPAAISGQDLLVSSQTGSGKTAAFMLPSLHQLADLPQAPQAARTPNQERQASRARGERPRYQPAQPKMLVLTPTRELALQVTTATDKYGAYMRRVRVVSILGGMPYPKQMQLLSRNPEILVATPGRLIDHMESGKIDFSQLQILVLDEADRMLDMGFLPDLQRIINLLPKQRQNLLFSATFSPEIKKLAASFQNNPVTIEVARSNATAENVTQTIYKVEEAAKADAVSFIIRQRELKQVIVFSNTKIGASRLARTLLAEGVKASAIHGDKTQSERMAALESFKQGQIEVLVATDVAARGLDIAELPCVINYDLPYNAEDYVHRIGRTGRAGASGDAISLFCDKDERLLVDIEKLIKKKFERAELAGFAPRMRADRGERGERGERSERGERAERGDRSDRGERSRGSRDGAAPSGRREKVDPWFLKPYEPSATETVSTKPELPKNNRPKPKVAALLGGIPKR